MVYISWCFPLGLYDDKFKGFSAVVLFLVADDMRKISESSFDEGLQSVLARFLIKVARVH